VCYGSLKATKAPKKSTSGQIKDGGQLSRCNSAAKIWCLGALRLGGGYGSIGFIGLVKTRATGATSGGLKLRCVAVANFSSFWKCKLTE